MSGFWDEDVTARYHAALRQRATDAGGMTAVRRVLLDLSHCTIQSQAVIDAHEKIIDEYTSQVEQYGMLLPRSALLRIQMQRLMRKRPIRYLQTEEEAQAWLAAS